MASVYKKNKLVCGVGINDADYPVCPRVLDGSEIPVVIIEG